MMTPAMPARARVAAYFFAVLAVAGTTGALHLLRDALSTPIIALFFLLPVGASAMRGLGSGLAAAFCAFLAFNFFFIPPYFTLIAHQTQDVLALIVFFIVAVVISQLVGRTQISRALAEAREREASHLYALSTALAGLRQPDEIAATLGRHLWDAFQLTALQIVFQPPGGAPAVRRDLPPGQPPASAPDRTIPVGTPRGALGEIRIWRAQQFDAANDQLLMAFAGQGALAVERAALAQADTRARVLEESDRLKTALLSSVSHELRTPLATLKAAATSLRSGDVPWESGSRAELLAAIDEEVDLVNRLVGNLLDMSRIESGALKPQREWNLLPEIVSSVLGRLKRAAHSHRLEVDMPDDLPLVPADYVQMEQVFSNLIGNSLKYAPPGTTVGIAARVQGDRMEVRVSNQGPPVPPEHLDRIFDKFYRVTAADRVTGTGLGLSICKGIVEAHGGNIWAENLPGGFAFHFTLPLTLDGKRAPSLPPEAEAA